MECKDRSGEPTTDIQRCLFRRVDTHVEAHLLVLLFCKMLMCGNQAALQGFTCYKKRNFFPQQWPISFDLDIDQHDVKINAVGNSHDACVNRNVTEDCSS